MGINEIIKIGDRLKTLRVNKGLTQAQLADAIKIPRTTYANYEANKRQPKIEVLNKITEYLGVTIDDILTKNFINKDNDERLYLLSLKILELIPSYSFEEIEEAIELTKKRLESGQFVISQEKMNKNDEIDFLVGNFSASSYQTEIAHILAIKTSYNLSSELYLKYFEGYIDEQIIEFLSDSIIVSNNIENETIAWSCILDTLGFEYCYDIIENDTFYRREFASSRLLAEDIKEIIYKEFAKIPKTKEK